MAIAFMNVVHVITSLELGGAERMLERLCPALRDLGVVSTVISIKNKGPLRERLMNQNIRVVALKDLAHVRQCISTSNLVQGWMYHGNLIGSALAGKRPCVWNIRASMQSYATSNWPLRCVMHLTKWLSPWPDAIIFNSERGQSQHVSWGYQPRRSVVMGNGFVIPDLQQMELWRKEKRQHLGLSQDHFVFLAVGRWHEDKDYPNLIRAFSQIDDERARLVVVGRGIRSADLKSLASLRARDRLILVDETQNVQPYFAAADAFVLSSRAEAFPNVLGEAMSFAKPCVATDVGDVALLLNDPDWVVPAQDSLTLGARMRDLMTLDLDSRRELSLKNRSRIESRYSLDVIAHQYVELYKDLVK